MGQIYTKKKDDYEKDERTMNATEFVNRMLSRQPENIKKVDNIESTL